MITEEARLALEQLLQQKGEAGDGYLLLKLVYLLSQTDSVRESTTKHVLLLISEKLCRHHNTQVSVFALSLIFWALACPWYTLKGHTSGFVGQAFLKERSKHFVLSDTFLVLIIRLVFLVLVCFCLPLCVFLCILYQSSLHFKKKNSKNLSGNRVVDFSFLIASHFEVFHKFYLYSHPKCRLASGVQPAMGFCGVFIHDIS